MKTVECPDVISSAYGSSFMPKNNKTKSEAAAVSTSNLIRLTDIDFSSFSALRVEKSNENAISEKKVHCQTSSVCGKHF